MDTTFKIHQPEIPWKQLLNGQWLKDQIIGILGLPWYILEKREIIYAMLNLIMLIINLRIRFYNSFAVHKAVGSQKLLIKTTEPSIT